jgi:hypothetical protein
MMLQNLIDAIRVTGALVLVFGAVPWWVIRPKHSPLGYCVVMVRMALFVEMSALVLGAMHLCLPGAMAGTFLLFCLLYGRVAGRPMVYARRAYWTVQIPRIVSFFDAPHAWFREWKANWAPRLGTSWSMTSKGILLIFAAAALAAFWHPLQYSSFLSAGTYSRVLSLQMLTLGQPVTLDGSVAWLAPVVFLSGLDAASVVRFSAPLLVLMLAAASSAATYHFGKSPMASIVAGGLTFAVAVSPLMNGELGAGAIGAIFWLLALALTKSSAWDVAWAIGVALLIGLPDQYTLLCISSTLLVLFAASLGHRLPRLVQQGVCTIVIAAILAGMAYFGFEASAAQSP